MTALSEATLAKATRMYTTDILEMYDLIDRFGSRPMQGPMRSETAQHLADVFTVVRRVDSKAEVFYEWTDGCLALNTTIPSEGINFLEQMADTLIQEEGK